MVHDLDMVFLETVHDKLTIISNYYDQDVHCYCRMHMEYHASNLK